MVTLTEGYAKARMEVRELPYITWEIEKLERRIKRIWAKAQARVEVLERRKAEVVAEYERMKEEGWLR